MAHYNRKKTPIAPKTTTLPSFRVQCFHIFKIIGLDYAGHLYYKSVYKSPQYRQQYIPLFACSVTGTLNLDW